MVTTKKHRPRGQTWLGLLLVASWLLGGCSEPGPRALLKGERLIRDGKFEQAVQRLQTASRLLPKNAQAWNYLGLAYHGNQQYPQALDAYQKALALDYKLAAAHYNLGCLLLELHKPSEAIDQLVSYTYLQPNAVDGWMRLATAELRARKLDGAEKHFKTALELHPRDPEALNGLGVAQVQRRKPLEALNYFNAALAQNSNYGPALLNSGVLCAQNLNNRLLALQKYRQFLALKPQPANWDAVAMLASELEAALKPPSPQVAQFNAAPPVAVKTNFVPSPSNPPARIPSNSVAGGLAPVRTNVPSLTNVSKVLVHANQANTNHPLLTGKTSTPEVAKISLLATNKPIEVEVTQLPKELVIKPPQELSALRTSAVPANSGERNAAVAPPLDAARTNFKPEKRGILSRLNPFPGKAKTASDSIGVPSSPGDSPDGSRELVVAARSTNSPLTPTTMALPTPVARYAYLSPPKPSAGNRREAERFFASGVKAQQAGRPAQALSDYQRAVQLDPAYFEAYYNQGLVAYEAGQWKQSLATYEYALALRPDSMDARYNFALALKQANYPQDAADELLEITNVNPKETRAYFSLGNLYAQQLKQPKLAREQYLKVLENDPRHPKAAEIRYWLATNR